MIFLSIGICASSPYGFESGMWDLIILIDEHFLHFYDENGRVVPRKKKIH